MLKFDVKKIVDRYSSYDITGKEFIVYDDEKLFYVKFLDRSINKDMEEMDSLIFDIQAGDVITNQTCKYNMYCVLVIPENYEANIEDVRKWETETWTCKRYIVKSDKKNEQSVLDEYAEKLIEDRKMFIEGLRKAKKEAEKKFLSEFDLFFYK